MKEYKKSSELFSRERGAPGARPAMSIAVPSGRIHSDQASIKSTGSPQNLFCGGKKWKMYQKVDITIPGGLGMSDVKAQGKIIWIHPKERFALVEYKVGNVTLRTTVN